ncbi:MAG: aldo/keto reductase, partial [Bifidobacteriaceae bacterium]|nr:aldo/keto reductase [Bifidobacteriaceae bacterium]
INPTALAHYTSDAAVFADPPTVERVFSQFETLKKEGLIRSIGISNFGVKQMAAAAATVATVATASDSGQTGPVVAAAVLGADQGAAGPAPEPVAELAPEPPPDTPAGPELSLPAARPTPFAWLQGGTRPREVSQ